MGKETYYDILGLDPSASDKEIKKAWRSLAGKHHPDRSGDSEYFKELSEAYEVLSNPAKKADYDQQLMGGGSDNVKFSDSGSGFGFNDFDYSNFSGFDPQESFFSTFFNTPQVRQYTLEVDIATSLKGAVLSLSVDGGQVKVRIPAGVVTGDKVKAKVGAEEVVFVITVADGGSFTVEGLDLYTTLEVPFYMLMLGGLGSVVRPDGVSCGFKIPSGCVSGKTFKLAGKGVVKGAKKGALYVKVLAQVPADMTQEQRLLVEQLASSYS